MKKATYILIMLACVACTRDAKYEVAELRLAESVSILTPTTVQLSLDFDASSKPLIDSVEVRYASEDTPEDIHSVYLTKDAEFTIVLSGFTPDKQYTVSYWIRPSYLQQKEYKSSFVTHCNALPETTTGMADHLTPVSAKLHGSVAKGVSEYMISEYGFYYSLLQTGEYERHQVKCGENTEGCTFSADINTLRAGATYYYYAYSVNVNGIAYGDTLSFTLPKTYRYEKDHNISLVCMCHAAYGATESFYKAHVL